MFKGRNGNVGDIQQLVALLEKSSESQRNTVLELLQKTEPAKAALVKKCILTIENIFLLDEESLSRILEDLSENDISHALRGIDLELRLRALNLVNLEKRNQIISLIKYPCADQKIVENARSQVIARVRLLETRGLLHLGILRASFPTMKKSG